MAKKRRFRTYEIEQHSQPSLPHGSPHRTQSCRASQPAQPHGSSQPHHLHRTSRPSNSHSTLQPHEVEEQLDANDQFRAAPSSKTCETPVEQIGLQYGDIEEMLHDVFYMHTQSSDGIRDERNEAELFSQGPSEQAAQEPNKNAQRFYELLKDVKRPLYEGCKNFSKLSAIVHWYHLKCLRGLSNETFTMTLQSLKAILPPDAELPKDCYEAKKIIKDLGLGYEKIHA